MRLTKALIVPAVAVSLVMLLPAGPAGASNYPIGPGGGCSGKIVSPAKPADQDWSPGEDLQLFNCEGTVHFAEVFCHPTATVVDDTVCWTYRIPKWTEQDVSVPWNRQASYVDWY